MATTKRDLTDQTISQTVRALLGLRHISGTQLAAKAGFSSQQTFSAKLNGGSFNAREVQRLADALEVPVGDLYAGRVEVSGSLTAAVDNDRSAPGHSDQRRVLAEVA